MWRWNYVRVSQPFWPATPVSRYWGFGDPQALIFTMIMMIILRFDLSLVVFYDDFPFPYWKENYFYSFICLGDTLPFEGLATPLGSLGRLGNPEICHYLQNNELAGNRSSDFDKGEGNYFSPFWAYLFMPWNVSLKLVVDGGCNRNVLSFFHTIILKLSMNHYTDV